ncbi:hypothetical protein IAT38_004846 [Cryptococcus sp. DSM 104549]
MPFTPMQTFVGGLLLHISTSQLLADTGRVFGISGIVDGAVWGKREGWRWAVVGGLVLAPAVGAAAGLKGLYPGDGLSVLRGVRWERLALAGALVGVGSRLGSGCTSGHMLCGVSRLSPRSLVATAVFFTSAVITANIFPLLPTPSTPAYALDIPSSATVWQLTAVVLVFQLAYKALQRYTILSSTPAAPSPAVSAAQRLAPHFLAGLTFSTGLALSGMTDPSKVFSFLRFPSPQSFDPSLAMVMLGGVLPNAIHYARLVRRARAQGGEPKPRLVGETWSVPSRRDLDWRLVTGAVVFGVGWGLAGVCPGPALVTLGEAILAAGSGAGVEGWKKTGTFVATMLGGMLIGGRI